MLYRSRLYRSGAQDAAKEILKQIKGIHNYDALGDVYEQPNVSFRTDMVSGTAATQNGELSLRPPGWPKLDKPHPNFMFVMV